MSAVLAPGRVRMVLKATLLIFFSSIFNSNVSAQSTLQGLGFIGGGGASPFSGAGGLSDDASVVVGGGSNAANQTEAFRWTSAGGMVGLGFLPTGNYSAANAVSRDGTIAVGFSNGTGFQYEATSWTAGGTITGLGFLGGPVGSRYSFAYGANIDGSVIVGASTYSNNTALTQAFTYSAGVMTGIGFIGTGGPNPSSQAEGVSSDGTVIVGQSTNTAGNSDAFRYQAGVFQDLGVVPGAPASGGSDGRAVSPDGTVVVGASRDPSGTTFEAFRWSQATGMVGLGYVGTGGTAPASRANGVSTNGTVIVGDSTTSSSTDDLAAFGNSGSNGAFRWSNTGTNTGMHNLYALLSAAGVNVSSFKSLDDAAGVSANGQFITGTGRDASNRDQAFLVRYIDSTVTPTPGSNPTPTPIGGLTTPESLINSVNGLGDTRQGLMVQHFGLAAPLLGASLPIGTGTEVGIFAAAGSVEAGGFGSVAFGNGVSLLGGIAYEQEHYRDAELKSAGTGAIAIRYVLPSARLVNPFVETGVWSSPNASLSFNRIYANGADRGIGMGDTSGSLGYAFGRAGLVGHPSPADEWAVSGEFGYEWLRVAGYAEPLSRTNPFDAQISAGTDSLNVGKIRAQWTHEFSRQFETTIYVDEAHAFAAPSGLYANVSGIGLVHANSGLPTWTEYGARASYKITRQLIVDVFVDALSGDRGVGNYAHFGADVRWRF